MTQYATIREKWLPQYHSRKIIHSHISSNDSNNDWNHKKLKIKTSWPLFMGRVNCLKAAEPQWEDCLLLTTSEKTVYF